MVKFDYHPAVDEIYEATTQKIIIITEDKLTITLNEHQERIIRNRNFEAPLGIIFTIILVLVTTQFQDAFGIEKATWRAIFIFALIACVIWEIRAIIAYSSAYTVKELIAKIKAECISPEGESSDKNS